MHATKGIERYRRDIPSMHRSDRYAYLLPLPFPKRFYQVARDLRNPNMFNSTRGGTFAKMVIRQILMHKCFVFISQ